MKYNLLLMLNDEYVRFGIIFLNSLYINANMENIHFIYINNIGLSEENIKNICGRYPKVKLFHTNKMIGFTHIHSNEWLESLTMKTKTLYTLIQQDENIPMVLIDSDMLIIGDFSHVIDLAYDIQICKCNDPYERNDLDIKQLDYIACFLVVNNNTESTKQFISDWIEEIKYMMEAKLRPAYETPSLCKTIQRYRNVLKIGDLHQDEIAGDIKYVKNVTKIIHMRSSGQSSNHFESRISNVEGYSREEILKYLY